MRTWHYRNTVRKHVGILAYQLVDARLNGKKGNCRPHRPCLWAMRNQVLSVVSPIVGGRGSMIRRIYPELSRLLAWPKRMFPRVSRVPSVSACVRNFCTKPSWKKLSKDSIDSAARSRSYLYVDLRIWASLAKCGWERKRQAGFCYLQSCHALAVLSHASDGTALVDDGEGAQIANSCCAAARRGACYPRASNV